LLPRVRLFTTSTNGQEMRRRLLKIHDGLHLCLRYR
jgi:hypothetical protein